MPVDEFKSFTKCLISDAADIYKLKGYEKHYLVKSKSSGFVFCSRIPTQPELESHYLQYDRQDYLSPLTVKRFEELLDTFEPFRRTNKILDIGCGVGFLMEQAIKRGWEVYGSEYTDNAIAICKAKGINMKQGKLDPAWFPAGTFDVITSLEVIEHINNPIEEVNNIKTLLRAGGLFYFTTPNFNAIERFILKDKYSVIEYPEHLSYYTPKTIHHLLSSSGFKKLNLTSTGISITRIKNGFGKSERLISAQSSDEKVRNRLEGSKMLSIAKNLLNKLFTFLGTGNSLKGWYINK